MVIAERSKKYYIPLLILGIIGIIAAIWATVSPDTLPRASLILSWIISIVSLLIALYGLLSPRKAIVKSGDYLIINYLFCKKVIQLDTIENVSTTERGEYYNRKHSVSSDIAFFKDMRILTVNHKENNILCHSSVFIKNASAVKCSIDSIINTD